MVVEFLGPAGVGKTTIVNALLKAFPESYQKGSAYELSSLLGLLRKPSSLLLSLRFLWTIGGRGLVFSKSGINWLAVVGAYNTAIRNSVISGQVVVFDQLLMQALRRISKQTGLKVTTIIKNWSYMLEVPRLVVLLQSPIDLHLNRAQSRGDLNIYRDLFAIRKLHHQARLDNRRALRRLLEMELSNYLVLDARTDLCSSISIINNWVSVFRDNDRGRYCE